MFVYQFKLCVHFPTVATKLSLGQKLPAWIVFIFYWVPERQVISKYLMITKATFNEKDRRYSVSPVSLRHQDEERSTESSRLRVLLIPRHVLRFFKLSSVVLMDNTISTAQTQGGAPWLCGSAPQTFVFPLLCTELSALPLCCVASDLHEPVDSA